MRASEAARTARTGEASYRELARAMRALSDADLERSIPTAGAPHSVRDMLNAVIEHGAYHGGHMALLKRGVIDAAGSR